MGKPFKPGPDPRRNPGGRPKAVVEVVELARNATPEVMARLVEIAISGDERAAVAAAKEVLDRGWGKAPQTVTVKDDRKNVDREALERRVLSILARKFGVDLPATQPTESSDRDKNYQ